jgi:fructuronate reductase
VNTQSVDAMLAYAPVFGDLAGNATLTAALIPLLQSLQTQGVAATLEAVNRGELTA